MSSLTRKQLEAIDRVIAKPPLQPFFFSKVKGLKWFDEFEKRGFFRAENNPPPSPTGPDRFVITLWPILRYLERTAEELLAPQNRPYSARYMNLIREVTLYSKANGVSNYRTWWMFSKMLAHVDLGDIAVDDISLVEYWLSDRYDTSLAGSTLGEDFLPRILAVDSSHCRLLTEALVRQLSALKFTTRESNLPTRRDASLVLDDYHAGRLFREHAQAIGARLLTAGVGIFRGRVCEILKRGDFGRYSAIWRPAIEDHEQNLQVEDTTGILITALRDCLSGCIDRDTYEGEQNVRDLLSSGESVLERVAINAVARHQPRLRGMIDECLAEKFFSAEHRHEMYALIHTCIQYLSDEQRDKVRTIIRKVASEHFDEDQPEAIRERQRSFEALRWLSAVRGMGFASFDSDYGACLAITGEEPQHPDFSSYSSGGWVGETSPHTVDELLGSTPPQIRERLLAFEEEGGWRGPTKRGLALSLKGAIKRDPARLRGQLRDFVTVDPQYLSEIVDAYRDVWNESGYDAWQELLEFSSAILKSRGRAPEQDRGSDSNLGIDYWGSVAGSIADLLRSGMRDDARAFAEELLPAAKTLIDELLEIQPSRPINEANGAVTYAINSPRGKVLEALVEYALRCCRLSDRKGIGHESVWSAELADTFEREVRGGSLEFAVLFPLYIPNLLYMNRDWTIAQVPRVFDEKNRVRWLCAIQGYAHTAVFDRDVYAALRDEGHISGGLDALEPDSSDKGRLIDYIAIAYLRDEEALDDPRSLLRLLLLRGRVDEIRHLIWFVWTVREAEISELPAKVQRLWRQIDGLEGYTGDERKRVLSTLSLWSTFVTDPHEEWADLLLASAPFADHDHHSAELVKSLCALVESAPVLVAKAYMAMLSEFAPVYPQEDVENTVRSLAAGAATRTAASQICDRYLEWGVEFPAQVLNSVRRPRTP